MASTDSPSGASNPEGAVSLPSRPASIVVSTGDQFTSNVGGSHSRTRTNSDSSLKRTHEFYNVSPARQVSSERLGRPISPEPILGAQPRTTPSSHSASILPSSSFFNPKRPGRVSTGPGSPSISNNNSPLIIDNRSSPRFTSDDGHTTTTRERRGNGPLVTRVTSTEYSSGVVTNYGAGFGGIEATADESVSRPSSAQGQYQHRTAPSLHSQTRSSMDGGHALDYSGASTNAPRDSSEAEAVATISNKASREPLIDFPNTAKRSPKMAHTKNLPSDDVRRSPKKSFEGVVKKARDSFSMARTNSGDLEDREGGPGRRRGVQLMDVEVATTSGGGGEKLVRAAADEPQKATLITIPPTQILAPNGRPMRNYQLHSGSNRFFFGGRVLSSKDNPTPFFMSLFLAVLLPILFFAFEGSFLWSHLGGGGKASVIIFIYLTFLMWVNMCATAWRDPGILPRNLDQSPTKKWVEDLNGEGAGGWRAEPRYMRIREGVVSSKWCETCETYRPPRTSHCRLCDNCVNHTDHHCTFLNNCIGRRNYTSFFAFLVSAVFCAIYVIAFSGYHISKRHTEDPSGSWASRWDVVGSFIVAVLSFCLLMPILGLLGYHLKLLWINRTTIEMLRPKVDRTGGVNPMTGDVITTNLYALKSPFDNMVSLLCRPVDVESWIRPHAYAVQDARGDPVGGKEREGGES